MHSLPLKNGEWAHTLCLMLAPECGFSVNFSYEDVNGLPDFRAAGFNPGFWPHDQTPTLPPYGIPFLVS